MTWSFAIGRLLGSELRVHATFFLLLAWIGWSAYEQGGPPAAIENVAFVLALFACVVAHEFGHALMARRFGIKTPDITLLPIGGMARLERMPENPREEVLVALAGPAVNVVIAAAIFVVIPYGPGTMDDIQNLSGSFMFRLATLNLFLAVFNLIPAFPMDGGRVLRAVLAMFMPRVKATRVAGSAGQVVAFAMGLWGLNTGNLILLLIAVFIFMAASAETSEVALQSMARNLQARHAMITSFERLAPSDTLDTAANTLIRTTQHEFPVVTQDDRLAGILTRNALFQALSQDGPRTRTVDTVMTAQVPVTTPNAPLSAALDALHDAAAPGVVVVTPSGKVLGYITRDNIGELMVVSGGR